MIDIRLIRQKRAGLQTVLDMIPPTDPQTAEWQSRHEQALRLQGAIEALDQLLEDQAEQIWDINECSPTCHLIAGHIGEHDES